MDPATMMSLMPKEKNKLSSMQIRRMRDDDVKVPDSAVS
jgi:hypothetical protein